MRRGFAADAQFRQTDGQTGRRSGVTCPQGRATQVVDRLASGAAAGRE
jgi:hypothetical protein